MALVGALVVPAQAGAVGVGDAYRDYAKDGSLDACKYSAEELQTLLSSVPTDIAQYDPRFVDELNRALDARASGACNKKGKGLSAVGGGSGTGSAGGTGGSSGSGGGSAFASDGSPKPVSTAPTGGGTSAVPAAAATPEIGSDRGFPVALGVLVGLLSAILLGTVGWAAARHYGWHPAAFIQGLREGLGR